MSRAPQTERASQRARSKQTRPGFARPRPSATRHRRSIRYRVLTNSAGFVRMSAMTTTTTKPSTRTAADATAEHVTACRELLAELTARLDGFESLEAPTWGDAADTDYLESMLLRAVGRGE